MASYFRPCLWWIYLAKENLTLLLYHNYTYFEPNNFLCSSYTMCHYLSLLRPRNYIFLWVKVNKIIFFFSLLSLVFEEPEDPTNRSFFSEIISSISDVKFSNSGRYMISRDYLSVKVWDLHMETKPIETYTVSNPNWLQV